ncbi:MAG: hypothetical protein B6230_07365 [Desulfobacteraceae bacterium 4572_89]|nr:MAG: hypothetical protein B6230_07365 [Desulfobacteraceae bacterium 4572_89]
MSNIDQLMRDCLKSMQDGELEKAADYFTEEGSWTTPFGTFTGKEQIRNFLDWQNRTMSWTAHHAGNDIIISDKKAFYEHKINARVEGRDVELCAMCAWEFDKNDKVKAMRTVYDRFSTLEQAATGIGKFFVNQVGKKFEVK